MSFISFATLDELAAACSSDFSLIDNFSEDELAALINFLIENLELEKYDELLEHCLSALDKFDGYNDEFDNNAVISEILGTYKLIFHCKRLRVLKSLAFTAAVLAVGVFFLIPTDANSRKRNFIFNYSVPDSICTNISDVQQLQTQYPDLMLPEFIPENFSFYKAEIFYPNTNDENITAHFSDNSSSSFKFSARLIDPNTSPVSISFDTKSYSSHNIDGVVYHSFTSNGIPNIIFNPNNEYLYILSADTTNLSSDDILKIALSFE